MLEADDNAVGIAEHDDAAVGLAFPPVIRPRPSAQFSTVNGKYPLMTVALIYSFMPRLLYEFLDPSGEAACGTICFASFTPFAVTVFGHICVGAILKKTNPDQSSYVYFVGTLTRRAT
jgi:hypothetical protein